MYERHQMSGGVYVCARCGAEVAHACLDDEDEGAPILCDADCAREVGPLPLAEEQRGEMARSRSTTGVLSVRASSDIPYHVLAAAAYHAAVQ